MKITFIGHSAFALEADNYQVLIDPFITGNPAATVSSNDFSPQTIILTMPTMIMSATRSRSPSEPAPKSSQRPSSPTGSAPRASMARRALTTVEQSSFPAARPSLSRRGTPRLIRPSMGSLRPAYRPGISSASVARHSTSPAILACSATWPWSARRGSMWRSSRSATTSRWGRMTRCEPCS